VFCLGLVAVQYRPPWNVWECRTDFEIAETRPDIGNSSSMVAVKCTWRGSLLGSVEMQLACVDWEPYFQWEAAREAMNTDIVATSQESAHCSACVQTFCQELIYLGSYTRVHVSATHHQPQLCLAMMEKDASTRATLKMGRGGEQGDAGPTRESKAQNGCDAISSHWQEAK
jgi:hypothetical protein